MSEHEGTEALIVGMFGGTARHEELHRTMSGHRPFEEHWNHYDPGWAWLQRLAVMLQPL
jgi:hypothetical protein